jgi:hypothetical protein
MHSMSLDLLALLALLALLDHPVYLGLADLAEWVHLVHLVHLDRLDRLDLVDLDQQLVHNSGIGNQSITATLSISSLNKLSSPQLAASDNISCLQFGRALLQRADSVALMDIVACGDLSRVWTMCEGNLW